MLRVCVAGFLILNSLILYAQNNIKKDFPSPEEIQRAWRKNSSSSEVNTDQTQQNLSTKSPKSTIQKTKAKTAHPADPIVDELDAKLLQQALDSTAPMSPSALQKFSDALYQRALVSSEIPGGPYHVRNRMIKLNLAPGASPEKLSLAMGQGVVVSFIDRHGRTLIIDSVKSHSKAFTVFVPETEQHSTEGASSFAIETKSIAATGNLSVLLKSPQGQSTPVLLQLESGRNRTIDGLVQLVHPSLLGQTSAVVMGDSMASEASFAFNDLQPFLAGIAPDPAQELTVPSKYEDLRAWVMGQKVYIRTQHAILSPAWFKRQVALDGTTVYELPYTPLFKLSLHGAESELTLDLPYTKHTGQKP